MSFGIEFLKDDPKYPSTLKPDIVVITEKIGWILDVAIVGNEAMATAWTRKLEHYEPFRQRLQRAKGLKSCTIVPVIMSYK